MNKITLENSPVPVKNNNLQAREHVLTVRLTFNTYDTLKRVARDRSTSVSEVVRSTLNRAI